MISISKPIHTRCVQKFSMLLQNIHNKNWKKWLTKPTIKKFTLIQSSSGWMILKEIIELIIRMHWLPPFFHQFPVQFEACSGSITTGAINLIGIYESDTGQKGEYISILHLKSWLKVLKTFPFSSSCPSFLPGLQRLYRLLSDRWMLPIVILLHSIQYSTGL